MMTEMITHYKGEEEREVEEYIFFLGAANTISGLVTSL